MPKGIRTAEYTPVRRRYTVLGVYDASGRVYNHSFEAETPLQAMIEAGKKADKAGLGDGLQIIGAVAGDQVLFMPGEDNGTASYACDLAALGDEG